MLYFIGVLLHIHIQPICIATFIPCNKANNRTANPSQDTNSKCKYFQSEFYLFQFRMRLAHTDFFHGCNGGGSKAGAGGGSSGIRYQSAR